MKLSTHGRKKSTERSAIPDGWGESHDGKAFDASNSIGYVAKHRTRLSRYLDRHFHDLPEEIRETLRAKIKSARTPDAVRAVREWTLNYCYSHTHPTKR